MASKEQKSKESSTKQSTPQACCSILPLCLLCKHFINNVLPQLSFSCLNNHLCNFYTKIIRAVLLVQPKLTVFLSKYPHAKLALRSSPQRLQLSEKLNLFTSSPQKAVVVCLGHLMCNTHSQYTQVTRLHTLSIAKHFIFVDNIWCHFSKAELN